MLWVMHFTPSLRMRASAAKILAAHLDFLTRSSAAEVIRLGSTIQLKSAATSPSHSPTSCRFKHSQLASRVSDG